ncbi:hypothetical protein LAZ67_12002435 [Cordylochernes scorpioides]|uniref:Uncharacterized protein n=1 Tax=Cordylochernes scorpioides TaxID=51811 RepID=A0ABY6L1R3_9ARAC|nr:hypothetical protein LAZ67_12002435 [Cordylochernes scorpioides]
MVMEESAVTTPCPAQTAVSDWFNTKLAEEASGPQSALTSQGQPHPLLEGRRFYLGPHRPRSVGLTPRESLRNSGRYGYLRISEIIYHLILSDRQRKSILAVLLFAAALVSAAPQSSYRPSPMESHEPPRPYAFNYMADLLGGRTARQESSDGSGRVVGSYTLQDDDGRQRTVEYVADETGFRASVRTNEPGTKSESPADVVFESTAPEPVLPLMAAGPHHGPIRAAASRIIPVPVPMVHHRPAAHY